MSACIVVFLRGKELVRKAYQRLIIGLLMGVIPLFGCFRYYEGLSKMSDEWRPLYYYWLFPQWSPVLYASNMYLYGSILGVILGLLVWKPVGHSAENHFWNFVKLAKLILFATLIGVLIWLCFDLWYTSGKINFVTVSIYKALTRDVLAIAAVYQYMLFWSVMAYGIAELVRWRIIALVVLVGEQLYELFWGMHHLQRLEVVLPTAISRIPIALSYPVWKDNSWASDYPSLIASTPMTFTSKYQIVDVGIPWVIVVEVIYISLVVCAVYFRSLRRSKVNEVVQTG